MQKRVLARILSDVAAYTIASRFAAEQRTHSACCNCGCCITMCLNDTAVG